MNRPLLTLSLLAALACAKSLPQAGGAGEPCVANGDCAGGFVCSSGRCALPANLGGCEPGATRCNGADVEQCSASGLGFDVLETCATGCSGGACRPKACQPGAQRCEGDAAEACSPSGDAWVLVQQCATHCNADTGRCKSPTCAPFSARCDPGGAADVWVCDAYGGGYAVTACGAGEVCANGACTASTASCTIGDARCNGRDAQRCEAGSAAGTTRWSTRETCVADCSAGVCSSAGACTGLALHAAVSGAPADGVSTVLFYSDPVRSADGAPLPDGQLFTITVATAGGSQPSTVASADADGNASNGVQVRSAGGRLHFSVLAPVSASGDAVVTATARLQNAPGCGASASLPFSSPGPNARCPSGSACDVVLVAEDFTRGANFATSSAADWNLVRNAGVAAFPLPAGDGRDGALHVAADEEVILSQSRFARAYRVMALAGAGARIDLESDSSALLQGGDEVVLWDVAGSASGSANAGSYELLTVAGISGDQVTFTRAVQGFYGAAGDQAVTTQHVVLQRIPHFSALTIDAGGKLRAAAWDGKKGGLLFARVAGAAIVRGEIDMDGAGFRGAATSSAFAEAPDVASGAKGAAGGGYATAGGGTTGGAAYGTASLSQLHLGGGAGCGSSCAATANGGGAVVLVAKTLSLQAEAPSQAFVGSIHANGRSATGAGGGAGGTVWLGAGNVVLGVDATGAISAQGANAAQAGGAGRVRLDFISTDATGLVTGGGQCRTAPVCTFGARGPLALESGDALLLTGALNFHEARLELAVGGVPGALYRASATNTDPPDFLAGAPITTAGGSVQFDTLPTTPKIGKRFRWRAELSPEAGETQLLLGLQWSLVAY